MSWFFHVSSGDMDTWVWAKSFKDAFKKAIDKDSPESLGSITSLKPLFGKEYYSDTIRRLNEHGYMGEEEK
jgi:hypothetical protein